ncbi:DISARM system SNF2-like helicase DrmD [Polyangium spumosum]|uniref:DISARM system SNF2-like helicase DrmD n=1 Tax=Polyangium spumosum TaxID=889282 RepID=UPI00129BDC27
MLELFSGKTAIRPNPSPDDPRTFAAYLHALRWGCVTSTDPTLFQAPLRAGIVPKSYQLEPLRKALALPRVNLFIADDVGLGKTIEAGLVLQELLLRQRVHRVVIAAPASVVLQWRDELGQRFGLAFAVLDKAYVNARRRERGFGVNPWTTHRHFLISHNLLRDEDYLIGLRDWLGDFCPGSLFILDEAHVAAPASESKYAIDSQTTRAVRDIARRFEHRLFLSATPHNGHSNSFSALLEILDPQRFTRGVPPKNANALKPVMVRRLKGELRKHIGSQIPEREVRQIDLGNLPPDTPEILLSEKLAEYTEILERRLAAASNRAKAAGKLVTIALQKRLLSSVEAFARTLSVHRKSAAKSLLASAAKAPAAVQTSLFESDEDLTDEVIAELEDVAVARATQEGAAASDDARAQVLLDEMSEIAERARGLSDAKIRWLVGWIRENQCPKVKGKATWLPRRMLIFTEYVDTKNYLVRELEAAIAGTDLAEERILTLHGGMDEEARERVKQAFNDASHPVRILIGTDAAREGVNLQAQCADLFHFDLPWNPGRMEQRNGRIDRMLQPEKVVRCHYFVYPQRPEDAVLAALVKKTERIRKQLGSLADVVERRLENSLKDGIRRSRALELAKTITEVVPEEGRDPVVEEELEQARDKEIVAQLEELQKLDQKATEHLDLKPERLRDVVNVGLRLASLPPLTERKAATGSYDVPPLDKLAGTDATWRDIMDTLRAPRTRKLPEWEWRAKNPPRPVSFEPSTTLASETVQLHLQHKLTQRVLAQFRAQAFGEDRLSRVTVAVDATHRRNRVLALGRLSLYGVGASRLHEEILVVAAYWSEGDDPSRLKAFETAEAEERALESLFGVLGKENQLKVADHVVEKLMQSAPKDEDALWETLKSKALRRIFWAEEKLRVRGRAEAAEMERILLAQKTLIGKELVDRKQLTLPWATDEEEQKHQFEADTRHMEKRAAELDKELEREPQRIREQYEVRHHRLERVGLVYLWPATS